LNFFFEFSSSVGILKPSLATLTNLVFSYSVKCYITNSSIGSSNNKTSYPPLDNFYNNGDYFKTSLFEPDTKNISYWFFNILSIYESKLTRSSPDVCVEWNLANEANLFLFVGSSMIPSLIFLPNSFQNFLYLSFFSYLIAYLFLALSSSVKSSS